MWQNSTAILLESFQVVEKNKKFVVTHQMRIN